MTMYVCSKQFFSDFSNDPRKVIDTLQENNNRIVYGIVSFLIFCRVVFSEYRLNHCLMRAASLAFALLLILIPLVASISFLVAGLFEIQPEQIRQILEIFLPYTPTVLLNYLGIFFLNAQKLRGLGICVLIIVTVGLFGCVEESLNTIWKVSRVRTFFMRLRTFTLVMVYSPILFFASFQFRQSPWLDFLSGYFVPVDILPFLLVVLGFSILFWIVPNTKVKFLAALAGGVIAGILFEIIRHSFSIYIQFSFQVQSIYGPFGIVPLFLVSLYFLSIITLFGAEIAYVLQNFYPLLRSKKSWDRRVGDYRTYLTLRMMIDIASAFMKKQEPPTAQGIAKKYDLTEAQAIGILRWLIKMELIFGVNGKDAFVPSHEFSNKSVKDVLDAIEDQNRKIPSSPRDFTREYVSDLISSLKQCSNRLLNQLTFDKLIKNIEDKKAFFNPPSPR